MTAGVYCLSSTVCPQLTRSSSNGEHTVSTDTVLDSEDADSAKYFTGTWRAARMPAVALQAIITLKPSISGCIIRAVTACVSVECLKAYEGKDTFEASAVVVSGPFVRQPPHVFKHGWWQIESEVFWPVVSGLAFTLACMMCTVLRRAGRSRPQGRAVPRASMRLQESLLEDLPDTSHDHNDGLMRPGHYEPDLSLVMEGSEVPSEWTVDIDPEADYIEN